MRQTEKGLTGDLDNPQLQMALEVVHTTDRHLFLTGKAGTGKTTFLKMLKKSMPKRMIVVAPTGVAALNAGGVTLHSFFQLPFAPYLPSRYRVADLTTERGGGAVEGRRYRFNREKIDIIKRLDLLVIDEISMVRADWLDAVDDVLRRFRRSDLPFGGVQLLMIGDLYQLAPVVTDEDHRVLDFYYRHLYFFASYALESTDYCVIDLERVYRQSDPIFLTLLNSIRSGQMDAETHRILSERHRPHYQPRAGEGVITLTTHNHQANRINDEKLAALKGKELCYRADVEGEFPEYLYPTEARLRLKVGAQVMFCKNDMGREKLYYNGKIGTVTRLEEGSVEVQCPGESQAIAVRRENWENVKYELDEETHEIREQVIGLYRQVPLKLAWAITIHKSQGLTFERAIIDAGAAFAFGQVYVALSRLRTLEGMVLHTPINPRSLKRDPVLDRFALEQRERNPDPAQLAVAKRDYVRKLIADLLDLNPLRALLRSFQKGVTESGGLIQLGLHTDIRSLVLELDTRLFQPALECWGKLSDLWPAEDPLGQHPGAEAFLGSTLRELASTLRTQVLDPFASLKPSGPSRLVVKPVERVRERLLALAEGKVLAMNALGAGVTLETLLMGRVGGQGGLKREIIEETDTGDEGLQIGLRDEELMSALRDWRRCQAEREGKPGYFILHDRTLGELVKHTPLDLDTLAAIKGIGPVTLVKYGEELLSFFLTKKKGKSN